MRWSVALVAALVLAGCSSKDDSAGPDVGIAATDLAAGNFTQTVFPLAFAGGTREADLVFSETFGPADGCLFGFPDCPASSQRTLDLTPAVPADAPVELSIMLDGGDNIEADLQTTDATILRMSDEGGQSNGFSVLLVRAPAGTVTLQVSLELFPPDQDGTQLEVRVHSVTRADVVPPLLPVAITLGPGDIVNATGDGLQHFVAFPPTGPALRAVQYPFSIQVPEDARSGTWFLIGDADEALRLTGPNRTLSARLLELVVTSPVDLLPNQANTFTMEIPGHPLVVGLDIGSKPNAAGFGGGVAVLGNHQVSLKTPGNVEVLGEAQTCAPAFCDFSILRGLDEAYESEFLGEHLTPGSYEATITLETANDLQASGFALAIKQS